MARRARQLASGEDRQQEPDHDQGGPLAAGVDEHRRGHRAEPDTGGDERLEDPEHPGEHRVRRHAHRQREERHVGDRVAQTDDREQGQRQPLPGHGADQHERQAPQHQRQREPRAEVAAADEQRDAERPDHATGADGGPQRRDPRVAGPQQLERQHDHQHVQSAAHERLGEPEPEDQPQVAVAGRRPQPLDGVVDQGTACAAGRRRVAAAAGFGGAS